MATTWRSRTPSADDDARPSSSCQAGATSAAATSTLGSSLVAARTAIITIATASPAMTRRISWSDSLLSTSTRIDPGADDWLTSR